MQNPILISVKAQTVSSYQIFSVDLVSCFSVVE